LVKNAKGSARQGLTLFFSGVIDAEFMANSA